MKSCLPDDIPFGAIVSLINRSKFVFFSNRLRPLGLPAGQFPVLKLLAKEQNIMQDTLVRHYRLAKRTRARAVRKPDDGEYIRRITDPKNRRAVRLFLTKGGERAVPALQAINREWKRRISTGLPMDKGLALRGLMHRAGENIFAILQKGGDLRR
ncbi:MAG: MarR family transcriptional regulator [Methanoregula sp.]